MGYIERDYTGLRAECGAVLSAEEKTTFRHAMATFGFLIANNTRADLATWAGMIERHSSSVQAAECARVVIRAA